MRCTAEDNGRFTMVAMSILLTTLCFSRHWKQYHRAKPPSHKQQQAEQLRRTSNT